jgi:hypothetical protein
MALCFADCYVVTDNDELDTFRLGRVDGRVLFFRKTEIEDVPCVVPCAHIVRQMPQPLEKRDGLLDYNHGPAQIRELR